MTERKRPNILWYCTDQQRFDTIHALGNDYINTPMLDSLVKEGIAFMNTYTQSPVCTPSRASFLTGKYPASHHVQRNGNEYFPSSETLITKILEDEGYYCGLIGKLHLSRSDILERRPQDDGYQYFKWSHHPTPDYPEGHDYAEWVESKGVDPIELYESLSGSVGEGVPADLHQTTWCSEMAIDFIREAKDKPWLLSVNPFDPHPPFDPSPEYINNYNPEDMPYPLFQESDIEKQKHFKDIDQQTKNAVNPYISKRENDLEENVDRSEMGFVAPEDYDARQVKAYYYAMIEQIDHQLGRIINILKETGQYENTIIIFTSDHGELLGDHGLIYKGCRFYEGLTHVPLIISWPGKGLNNVRSDALVELIDLAPTILEAVGLEIPYYMQGQSLLSIIKGEKEASYHKNDVICEYNDAIEGEDHTHGLMYYDGRYKICIYKGHDIGEIYDLLEDPGEFNNLWISDNYKELKTKLLEKVIKRYMSTSSPGIRRVALY